MVTTQHLCAACGGEHIRRNGSSQGHAKYQCTLCDHQARFVPVAAARAVRYEQVEKLLVERNSQRSIVRMTGMARMTVAKLIKKKCKLHTRPYPACGRKRPNARNGRRSNSMKCGRLWASGGAKSGSGWRSSAPARASWPGCWAAATRPPHAACGKPCPAATGGIADTSPTCFRLTWACYRAGSTAAAPKAAAGQALSRPSIVPCASVAACSCERPAPSARPWPCTMPALKL